MSLQVVGVTEFPRVQPGDNLPAQVVQAITAVSWPDGTHGVRDGDIVVITSKVVSKCEGRIVTATSRDDVIDRETMALGEGHGERARGVSLGCSSEGVGLAEELLQLVEHLARGHGEGS